MPSDDPSPPSPLTPIFASKDFVLSSSHASHCMVHYTVNPLTFAMPFCLKVTIPVTGRSGGGGGSRGGGGGRGGNKIAYIHCPSPSIWGCISVLQTTPYVLVTFEAAFTHVILQKLTCNNNNNNNFISIALFHVKHAQLR